MWKRPKWVGGIAIITIVTTVFSALSLNGIAAENIPLSSNASEGDSAMSSGTEDENEDVLPTDTVGDTVGSSIMTDSGNILSVELPVIAEGEPSPFDFLLDPCGLLYETDAVRYGGGTVEESATMLFCNKEGEYDFSRYSDKLEIKNNNGKPVIVTVSASVSDLEGIELIGQDDFSGNGNPAIYLAMIDDQGNVQPIFAEGEATIQMELGSGVYSFGLTGACNSETDWQGVYVHPKVTVTWHVEPMPMEVEEEPEEKTESVSDGNIEPKSSDSEAAVSDSPAEEDDTNGQDSAGDVSENLIPPGGMTDDETALGDDAEQPEETVLLDGIESNTTDSEQSVEDLEKAECLEGSEMPSDTASIEADMSGNDTEESVLDSTGIDMDEKNEFASENTEQD